MPSEISRLFLVGCPRSGTTLLQSLLAAHSQICSFPESHFCAAALDNRGFWARKLGLAAPYAKQRMQAFFALIGSPELAQYLPRRSTRANDYLQSFVEALDHAATVAQKTWWLEKTPGHIRFITHLEKCIALNPYQVIHLVRNGADVVASLYEVTHKYPEPWRGTWSIERCVKQWERDVALSLDCRTRPNHILVNYETLVDSPAVTLRKLCQSIGLPFEETLLQNYGQAAKTVTRSDEPWKDMQNRAITNANNQKFQTVFTPEQQQQVINLLNESSVQQALTSLKS
ncbi:MAG: sulfotransferase [Cyanobacteria bacterium P01_H01_bin.15]